MISLSGSSRSNPQGDLRRFDMRSWVDGVGRTSGLLAEPACRHSRQAPGTAPAASGLGRLSARCFGCSAASTRRVISFTIASSDASRATVTAARTCSASTTATKGAFDGAWPRAPRPPARCPRFRLRSRSFAAASASGFTAGSVRWLRTASSAMPSASTAAPGFVERLQHARRQNHPHVPVARTHLQILADLVARPAGHHGVGQHHVGIHVFQAYQRGIGVADGDDFVSLFA